MSIEKRKRTRNTSTKQYEMYLRYMEEDYFLRSGTINPTLAADYLNKKWDELANELNCLGVGPNMSADEWKKRFNDWKYAVRAKCRKIKEHRTRTGSGPEIKMKLTDLEERALGVWGKVAVTGAPTVTLYDGVCFEENVEALMPPMVAVEETALPETKIIENENVFPSTSSNLDEQPTPQTSKLNPRAHYSRPKPLSVLAEKLIEATDVQTTCNSEIIGSLKDFANRYLKLEEWKFEFEIAKYSFEHPNFKFE